MRPSSPVPMTLLDLFASHPPDSTACVVPEKDLRSAMAPCGNRSSRALRPSQPRGQRDASAISPARCSCGSPRTRRRLTWAGVSCRKLGPSPSASALHCRFRSISASRGLPRLANTRRRCCRMSKLAVPWSLRPWSTRASNLASDSEFRCQPPGRSTRARRS